MDVQGLTAYSIHPGIVATGLQSGDQGIVGNVMRPLIKFVSWTTPLEASYNTLFVATSPEAVANAGCVFGDSRRRGGLEGRKNVSRGQAGGFWLIRWWRLLVWAGSRWVKGRDSLLVAGTSGWWQMWDVVSEETSGETREIFGLAFGYGLRVGRLERD